MVSTSSGSCVGKRESTRKHAYKFMKTFLCFSRGTFVWPEIPAENIDGTQSCTNDLQLLSNETSKQHSQLFVLAKLGTRGLSNIELVDKRENQKVQMKTTLDVMAKSQGMSWLRMSISMYDLAVALKTLYLIILSFAQTCKDIVHPTAVHCCKIRE